MAASVSPGDPLGIPTEAILADRRRQWCQRQTERLTHGQFRISALGEEALMSLSRTAGHLSLISAPSVVTRVILEAVQATG